MADQPEYSGLQGLAKLLWWQMFGSKNPNVRDLAAERRSSRRRLPVSRRTQRISSGDPTGGASGPNADAVRGYVDPEQRISLLEEELARERARAGR